LKQILIISVKQVYKELPGAYRLDVFVAQSNDKYDNTKTKVWNPKSPPAIKEKKKTRKLKAYKQGQGKPHAKNTLWGFFYFQ